MEMADGRIGIRFAPANKFSVLDHVVTLPDGRSILNPMRVVPNDEGSEVLFTYPTTIHERRGTEIRTEFPSPPPMEMIAPTSVQFVSFGRRP